MAGGDYSSAGAGGSGSNEKAQAAADSQEKAAKSVRDNFGGGNDDSNSGNNPTKKGNKAGIDTRDKPKGAWDSFKEWAGDFADYAGLDGEFGIQNRKDRNFSVSNLGAAASEALGDAADFLGFDGEFGNQNRKGRTFNADGFTDAVEEGWEDFKDWVGVDGQRGHQGATDEELEFSWEKIADAWDPGELKDDIVEGVKNIELNTVVKTVLVGGALVAFSPAALLGASALYANRGALGELTTGAGDVVDGALGDVTRGIYNATADFLDLKPATRAKLEGLGHAIEASFDLATDAITNPAGAVVENFSLTGTVGNVVEGEFGKVGFKPSEEGLKNRRDAHDAAKEHANRDPRSRREEFEVQVERATLSGLVNAKQAQKMMNDFDADPANKNADSEPASDGNTTEHRTVRDIANDAVHSTRVAAAAAIDKAVDELDQLQKDAKQALKEVEKAKEDLKNAPATAKKELTKARDEAQEAYANAQKEVGKARDKISESMPSDGPSQQDWEHTANAWDKHINNANSPEERKAREDQRDGALAGSPVDPNATGEEKERNDGNRLGNALKNAGDALEKQAAKVAAASGAALEEAKEKLGVLENEFNAAKDDFKEWSNNNDVSTTEIDLDQSAAPPSRENFPVVEMSDEELLDNGISLESILVGATPSKKPTTKDPLTLTLLAGIGITQGDDRQPDPIVQSTSTPMPSGSSSNRVDYQDYKQAASTFLAIEGLVPMRGEVFILRMRKEGISEGDIKEIVTAAGQKKTLLVEGSGYSNAGDALEALRNGSHPNSDYKRIMAEGDFHTTSDDLRVSSLAAGAAVEQLVAARDGKKVNDGPLKNIVEITHSIGDEYLQKTTTAISAIQEDTRQRMKDDPSYGPEQVSQRSELVKHYAANIKIHDPETVEEGMYAAFNQMRRNGVVVTAEAKESMLKDFELAKAMAENDAELPNYYSQLQLVAQADLEAQDSVALLVNAHKNMSQTREAYGYETQKPSPQQEKVAQEPVMVAQNDTATQVPAAANEMDAMLAGVNLSSGIKYEGHTNYGAQNYGVADVTIANNVTYDGDVAAGDVAAGSGRSEATPEQTTHIT